MKIYLDTNMILPYFDSLFKGRATPKVFRYLHNARFRYEYFVSTLTKVEIFRFLHANGADLRDCIGFWSIFKENLHASEAVISDVDFEAVSGLVAERPTRKGMIVNIIHLMFAKQNKWAVLTGDVPLKERFQVFYTKVMSYEDFRRM